MNKRLFIAVDLPDEVNRTLGEYAEVLRDIHWYKPTEYHLTIKFIGDTEQERFENIKEVLGQIEHPVFRLKVNRLGYFPPDRHPRVIWAGFEESTALDNLHQKVEERLFELGVEKEDRAFTPHVTLGRNKDVPRKRVESYIEKRNDIYIPDIPVSSFILYSSELSSDGAVHTPEETYSLID